MYLKLKKGKLREVLSKAINLAGSLRKLEKEIGLSKTTLSDSHNEKLFAIREDRLNKILNYSKFELKNDDIIRKLPNNWRQINGGKRLVQIRKENGTFDEQLMRCRASNNYKSIKLWHKRMKKEEPEKYHLMQYEKFKKIGGYKFITENKEKVRNLLEKEVADILRKLGLKYKYEALVRVGNKYFFPDFLIDENVIIECTAWRGSDKAIKLKDKINYLKKEYDVYVVIPKALKRYYEILNKYLVLGTDELVKILRSRGNSVGRVSSC